MQKHSDFLRCSGVIGLASASLAIAFPLLAQVPNPGSEGKLRLDWLKDYPAALQKAEAEKKPLLIDITTDWCGWSKKMERETFADLAVQKQLCGFVLIRLNPEASEKNQKIADTFGADSYPTLVIANYRGEELGEESGYSDAKDLLEFLKKYEGLFKGNPLGYKSVQLSASDALMQAMGRIPPASSRPTSVGSFVVLDQTSMQLQADGTAKMVTRTATFVSDPEKADLPHATRAYVSSRQKLKLKTVRILDTKGVGRELDVKLAKDEHLYSNQNVYWDARKVSLPVPTLQEGQILDVIEERECQPVMPNQFFFAWNTGIEMLLSSDLSITFPASLKLQKQAVRCRGEVQETKNADGTLTWRLRTSNTKPYEPELFSPAVTEIWEGYEFFTPCSKDAVVSWYSGLCQGRDALPAAAKLKVAELKKSSATQTACLQAIVDWVTKDIRYVSVAFGAASHQPHPVSATLTNLYGDCKDQALLVQALCREAGIPAGLVLLDAFGRDFEEKCPAIERFTHCIVEAKADGRTYYVDTAFGPAKLGYVPRAYAGVKALKLEGAVGRTVALPAYQPALDAETSQTVVKLNPNGSATVSETTVLGGQEAVLMKQRMKGTPPEKVRKYIEEAYKRTGRKLLDFYMTGTNAPGDKYESRLAYTVPRFGSLTAGGLAFKMGAQTEKADWVDALSVPRSQPFWFRANDASKVTFRVELPPGSVLKGQPQDLQLETAFIKADRRLVVKADTLTMTETTRFLDAKLEATQASKVYAAFRQLHDHRQYSFVVEIPPTNVAGGQ